MNNTGFGKPMKKAKRDIKFVAERRRNYLMKEPSFHTTNVFTENLLAIEIEKKIEILMIKPEHLGLSIIELSKTLMYEFL